MKLSNWENGFTMLTETTLSAAELAQIWREWDEHETLPDRHEVTEHGEIVMCPRRSNTHQLICAEIAFCLQAQLGGEAVGAVSLLTATAGIRVPDVTWMPTARWNSLPKDEDFVQAPELVVEVLSPGNHRAEMAHKIQAYLDSGISEVLVVALDGGIAFHRADGVHTRSAFAVKLDLFGALFR